MPETKDTDWDWDDFFHRNNDELVATWGNLANRVLSFAYKHLGRARPRTGRADPRGPAAARNGGSRVPDRRRASWKPSTCAPRRRGDAPGDRGEQLPGSDRPLVRRSRRIKAAAARSIYTALRAIDSLKILFAPFLPFTSEQLHTYLGYDQPLFGEQSVETLEDSVAEHRVLRYHPEKATGRWEPSQLQPGQPLRQPQPLFRKLDPGIVEEERARLGQKV